MTEISKRKKTLHIFSFSGPNPILGTRTFFVHPATGVYCLGGFIVYILDVGKGVVQDQMISCQFAMKMHSKITVFEALMFLKLSQRDPN